MDIASLESRHNPAQASTSGGDADSNASKLLKDSMPAMWGTLRRDLGNELVLSMAGHINRPFGHVAGWDTVRYAHGS